MLIGLLEGEELKKLPDNSVDLIITSPPYSDRRKNTYGGISEDKYVEWFKPIAIEIKRVLKLVLMLKRELGFLFVEEEFFFGNNQ